MNTTVKAALALAAAMSSACARGGINGGGTMSKAVPSGPIKAIVLLDDGWGSNLTLEGDAPSILKAFEAYGWEVTLVGPKRDIAPCPLAKANPGTKAIKAVKLAADIGDVERYDAVIVAPGRSHRGLEGDQATLDLLRRAESAGLAVGSFCRGLSVLAAAGIVSGRTVAGHPDCRAAAEAAGARFVDYADRRGKGDAPPPVVDGAMVTSLRSNYYRAAACEALRVAADNSRRARSFAAARGDAARGEGAAGSTAPAAEPGARAASAIFAFMLERGTIKEAALLAGSLRAWGGALSGAVIVAMAPSGEVEALRKAAPGLEGLGVRLEGFEPVPALSGLPLAMKAAAAAEAERIAAGSADELVWMDTDTVFAREPSELLLPPGALAAASPVHHRLVGRRWDDEPDPYWSEAFRIAGAPRSSDFKVLTVVDREPIGAYFNAGLVAVRPEAGILRAWRDRLSEAATDPSVKAATRNSKQELFLHQAILSAVLLAEAGPGRLRLLSFGYNYPLHMHGQVPSAMKPAKLDDLYTLRYDDWGGVPGADDGRLAVPERMKAELSRLTGRN